MGLLADTVREYEELRKHTYTIKVETGLTFSFRFRPANYHHLAGLQHLIDLADIANPPLGHRWFYHQVKAGKISEASVSTSAYFPKIQNRLMNFAEIKNILFHSNKIIVNFDRTKAKSDIVADFFLYRRDGDAINGPYTFYHLFLGHDSDKGVYYPATYIVETTKQYISDQEMLNCEITIE